MRTDHDEHELDFDDQLDHSDLHETDPVRGGRVPTNTVGPTRARDDDHPHPHEHGAHDHPSRPGAGERPLRIGIGGPVGSGKTTLVGALCRLLRDELSLAVVTNDIFTTEDAQALRRAGVLPVERIVAVETGCCPHTAIRDDIAANLDAIEELEARLRDDGSTVDVTFVESGGDNLTAVFSHGLVDAQIFVLDTAGGDDVPRKGGPGVAMADVLVINKVDLAPYVGADVNRMLVDAADRRSGKPVVPTSLVDPEGASAIAGWVRDQLFAWRRSTPPGQT
jgi:urease accessory protein